MNSLIWWPSIAMVAAGFHRMGSNGDRPAEILASPMKSALINSLLKGAECAVVISSVVHPAARVTTVCVRPGDRWLVWPAAIVTTGDAITNASVLRF